MAAKSWGMKPWEFRSLSRDHKAEIVALYIVDNEITGYYNSEQSKKMEKIRGEDQGDPRRR